MGLVVGCNMPVESELPIPSPDLTQVFATLGGRFTQTVMATSTLMITSNASVTAEPSISPTSLQSSPSQTVQTDLITRTQPALEACDRAGAGTPIDITIPDDTIMEPGGAFTKIWRLQNVGSCTWTTNYRVFFFSGEQLNAVNNLALPGNVLPGESVDISIDMVAPNRAGTFQGNWKLRSPNGLAFGIGPSASAPFWVRIVVEVTPTPVITQTPSPTFAVTPATSTPVPDTVTPSPTNTPVTGTITPSPTITETPLANLVVTLSPGDSLDLDSGEINEGAGQDIRYESNPDGLHRISPQPDAVIGIFGEQPPVQADCEAADLEADSLVAANLVQRYVCFRTGQNQLGWFYLQEINPNTYAAHLEFFTWMAP